MMRLMPVKLPKMANIAFHPRNGTTVLLNTTPITAEKPNPVKKRALTLTPSLRAHTHTIHKQTVSKNKKVTTYSVPYTYPARGGKIDC